MTLIQTDNLLIIISLLINQLVNQLILDLFDIHTKNSSEV